MEDLEKKLLAGGNENKSKSAPVSTFPEPVLASPVPVTAFTCPVKLSTYDGKTNWEVYKTQFSIISEANGWTEGVKACPLVASFRRETAEILQTLPDPERMNLNSLYNGLDLRFSQKYSKDYAHLQRLQKTGESLQKYASEVERLANLAFFDHPATWMTVYFWVPGLINSPQSHIMMSVMQDLTSLVFSDCGVTCRRFGCGDGIREEGLRDDYLELKFLHGAELRTALSVNWR
ncbi:uncharacterized protein TNCV_278201 [Trichonephila clavipes]|nr:uncharacterized protein TNCV_278201 [Trichonephila clavipes]